MTAPTVPLANSTTVPIPPVKFHKSSAIETAIPFIEADEFQNLRYSEDELQLIQDLTSRAPDPRSGGIGNPLLGQPVARTLPLLNAEEERVLFRRMNYMKFQAEALRSTLPVARPSPNKRARLHALIGDANVIRRTIVESNLRLVIALARKFAHSHQEFQEFLSEGLLILLGAIEKFDYSRGFRFSTYATHAIQRHFFRLCRRTRRDAQRFVTTSGEVMANVVSAGDSRDEPLCEPEAAYQQLMESAQDCLSEREESVLHRRFGTDGRAVTQTLREIAAELGVSKERVRQIQITALKKLRMVAGDLKLMPTAS